MEIKKGNLNFDQTGRAYPDNPHIKENWDCIWEYEGKYYKLVGDINHKEWEEVQLGEDPKEEKLNEAAENYSIIHGERYEVKGQLHFVNTIPDVENAFIAGAKWMEEHMKEQMESLKDFETWEEWKNK